MPAVKVTIPHELGQDEALRRMMGLIQQLETEFSDKIDDVHQGWEDATGVFIFSTMGLHISGTIMVGSSEVVIECKLPLRVFFLKGKIESIIRERATALLSSRH